MLLSTSTARSDAQRQRDCRRRQRQELTLAPVEVPDSLVRIWIDEGRLTEKEAENPRRLGEVLLAIAIEKSVTR